MCRGTLISAVFLGVFAGCGGDGAGPPAGPDPARAEVTYWKDVAPIVGERCLGCHQAGGVAPFRLDSYAEAKLRAPLMAVAVQARTMPPWLATGDGTCGEFQDSRWLSDTEIQTIARWVQQGAAEGTPRTDLPAPVAPASAGRQRGRGGDPQLPARAARRFAGPRRRLPLLRGRRRS